ncbi:hypothetical protein B0T21DRAFT_412337 [Apiosordaria backusii]|uniref:Uncharacterized protein n=1 Tax=Apiosordaria backusii TaxID=314023 RepID=A0AA40EHB1_9PEZI|nr:hypothetical protein B0T21DRAFT_412337 [Apiosordaria backusii]
MKLSIITFATSALALFGVAHASIVDVTWDLPINPADDKSATVSVTGTIEQAIAKMEADYPGWNATFMAQDPASDGTGITKHADPVKYNCNVPGDADARRVPIGIGISYLRRVPGTAKNGPGPENCGRVSCSWNAAIIWCNNNNFEKELQWGQIADGAAYVVDQCSERGHDWVKGHADYADGWYVVVRANPC